MFAELYWPFQPSLILAWEHSVAKVTKSYSCRLPALERFYRETKFDIWDYPLNLESQNQAKNIPVSRLPQSKIEANRSRGS